MVGRTATTAVARRVVKGRRRRWLVQRLLDGHLLSRLQALPSRGEMLIFRNCHKPWNAAAIMRATIIETATVLGSLTTTTIISDPRDVAGIVNANVPIVKRDGPVWITTTSNNNNRAVVLATKTEKTLINERRARVRPCPRCREAPPEKAFPRPPSLPNPSRFVSLWVAVVVAKRTIQQRRPTNMHLIRATLRATTIPEDLYSYGRLEALGCLIRNPFCRSSLP